MVKSQLIELLQKFTSDELRELQLFVASPFFNRGSFAKETQDLLDFIVAAAPDFSEMKLNRKLACNAVFPSTPVVEGKMDKVMSKLHKLSQEFISINTHQQKDNEFHQLLDRAIFYRTREMEHRYQNIIQKLDHIQKKTARRDVAFFQRQFLLDFELHNYEDKHNRKRDDVHIRETLKSLDLYYFILKIEFLNQYMIQQKVALLEIPDEMLQAIRESELPNRYIGSYPLLYISYHIFKMLTKGQPDISEFEHLHQFLRQHENDIHPELVKSYFRYIRNFCVLLVQGGRNELIPVLFQFQKEHYERGYLHYDDQILPTTFLSVSNTALKLKEYDWAKRFILAHANRVIGDNELQDYYRLILANYLFYTGEFDKALDTLPQTFQDLDFHLFSRRLELKIFYELNSDLLPYKIDAFKMYLSRASKKVLSGFARERNADFVNLLFQLSNTAKGDTARAQRLVQRIETKPSIADRDWLLEKAAQLA